MRHEGRPYYVGLLKAAELHGATHHAVMEFQVVTDSGYGASIGGGGYIGTGGSGTFNGAAANIGAELGLEGEFGFYMGCAPPQAGNDYWGFEIDFGPIGFQLNAGRGRNVQFAITAGPGTPGVTFNPSGATNVGL